jgi:hypothetical protein
VRPAGTSHVRLPSSGETGRYVVPPEGTEPPAWPRRRMGIRDRARRQDTCVQRDWYGPVSKSESRT